MYLKLTFCLGVDVYCLPQKIIHAYKYVDFIMTQNRAGLVVLVTRDLLVLAGDFFLKAGYFALKFENFGLFLGNCGLTGGFLGDD